MLIQSTRGRRFEFAVVALVAIGLAVGTVDAFAAEAATCIETCIKAIGGTYEGYTLFDCSVSTTTGTTYCHYH